jgi:hypothetical protein
MIDSVADRLPPWRGQLLSHSGRLELIRSTLTAMSIYVAICIGLPPWVIRALEKILKTFLWTGTDVVQGGKCLLAWKRVQRTKHLGGLGVLDLKMFDNALRLRWLWLQRTDNSHSWSLLPFNEDATTRAFFLASVRIELGNGRSLLFWQDAWLDGCSIADSASDLVQAVSRRTRSSRMVADTLQNEAWIRDITGPLTVPVLMQHV